MENQIVVCEKTGQRYKVSPTKGSSVHLTPMSPVGLDRDRGSDVAEKLGRLRKELTETKGKVDEALNDFRLERTKASIFRSALAIRKIYVACPECGNSIQAGDEHRSHCRHYEAEQYMRS